MTFTTEQRDKLELYVALLRKWQKTINLVSRNTLDEAWTRHIDDSAQLNAFLPQNTEKLLDLGSGAGFPGLVLAILNPSIDVTLVEADARKCAFLSTVSRETQTPVTIINERIEDVDPARYEVITARALASLTKLIGFSEPFYTQNPELLCLFLKGEKAGAEITEAQKLYNFDWKSCKSATDDNAAIIKIRNVSRETV